MGSKKKLLETTKPKKYLDIGCKKRLATLKKNASELAILCKAICIMEGPTGEVDIWLPESQAHALAIAAKYKESKKKPKLCEEANNQSTCHLEQLQEEEENEGSFEWFDTNEFVDKYFNIGENNDGVIDHHDNVEPNKGCSNISEIDQLPNYEEYNVGEPWKRIFEEFDFSEVISTIGTNVEGDTNHQQQNFLYEDKFDIKILKQEIQSIEHVELDNGHVLDNGLDSCLDVEGYNTEDSDQDFGFLGDIFLDSSNVEVNFSDGSSISNVEMPREPAGYIDQGHQNYDVFGMWPTSDADWQLPECSGLKGVYDLLPIVPYEFDNKNSDVKPSLSSLDKQPEFMDYIPTYLQEILEEN